MQPAPLLRIDNLSLQRGEKTLLQPITFEINPADFIAIIGQSGSGKSILAQLLAGQIKPSSGILEQVENRIVNTAFIPQQHDFRHLSSSRSFFQQRYDSNSGNDFPIVQSILNSESAYYDEILQILQIKPLLTKQLYQLSNGEGKRVQLAKALLQNPDMLILDQPFIGLDIATREVLHKVLDKLNNNGMVIVLICNISEIPANSNKILHLQNGTLLNIYPDKRDLEIESETKIFSPPTSLNYEKGFILAQQDNFDIAVKMNDVTVRYGENIILENIHFQIKKGEKWALTGLNGAGKSTLLSLITGDNPQAYVNDVILFDNKRGSGESIWDIKQKIGYISPELHLYFQRSTTHIETVNLREGFKEQTDFSIPKTTVFEVVASGMNDQIGSSKQISSLQTKMVIFWLEALSISDLKDHSYYKLSLGEQRLALLARALVKNPPMLILDEPCQGLDENQTATFNTIVEQVCTHFNKTLIYVTHYKHEIPSCINNYIELEQGRIKNMTYIS